MKYSEKERETIKRAARALIENARGLVTGLDDYLEDYGWSSGVAVSEYVGDALDEFEAAIGAAARVMDFDMVCTAAARAVDALYN